MDVNINTNNLNLTNGKLSVNGNGIVYFYSNSNLFTQYSGARIVLWPGAGTAMSTDWYGLRMNKRQLVCNVPSGQMHLFQVNGTQVAYVNSGGLVVPSGALTIGSSTAATQTWVQNQNYLTTSPASLNTGAITCTTIIMNSASSPPI